MHPGELTTCAANLLRVLAGDACPGLDDAARERLAKVQAELLARKIEAAHAGGGDGGRGR